MLLVHAFNSKSLVPLCSICIVLFFRPAAVSMSDKSCGAVILFFSFSLFVYYTFWVILSVNSFALPPHYLSSVSTHCLTYSFVQPIIDDGHVLQVRVACSPKQLT
jgi:hypothetical protein